MIKRKYFAIVAMSLTLSSMVACKPYDTPELITIEASQTAFLIPLLGDTENQASFESEELLAEAKIATKEVQIPLRWVKQGRLWFDGEWRGTHKLIIVDRTPVTREWNAQSDGGTSITNQSIAAESIESIGFSVGMNCSAQIYTENDAVKFLYSYNNKSLADIMDTEIRARVESKFVEECGKRTLNDILANKEEIMNIVRDDVVTYFEDKGITITVLGMKDGVEYDDKKIQDAINDQFSSEQKLVTQQNENKILLEKSQAEANAAKMKAEAEAEAIRIRAEAEAEANKKISESLTEELLKLRLMEEYTEKWNGDVPEVTSDSNSLININDFLNAE